METNKDPIKTRYFNELLVIPNDSYLGKYKDFIMKYSDEEIVCENVHFDEEFLKHSDEFDETINNETHRKDETTNLHKSVHTILSDENKFKSEDGESVEMKHQRFPLENLKQFADNIPYNISILTDNRQENNSKLQKIKQSMEMNLKTEEIIEISSESDDECQSDIECLSYKDNRESDAISYHSSDFEFIDEAEAKAHGVYKIIKKSNYIREYFDLGIFATKAPNTHKIPEGDEYLELFQRRYTPYPNTIMESKSPHSKRGMYVEKFGIGFSMQGPKQIVSDQLVKEASENAYLIKSMYPSENIRRRRRYV